MDLLSLLFPRRCLGCGELGTYLCPDCVNYLVPLQELYCPRCRRPSFQGQTHPNCQKNCALDGLISAYPYSGLMVKAITKFKYSFVRDLTDTLIELMISGVNHPHLYHHHWDLTPVPLHPYRQSWRGFNQATLLAQGLSHAWNLPLSEVLIRSKNTLPQMQLTGKNRRENLIGAFATTQSVPESILLVDDVATTCSTLNEAAASLKQAGAKQVWGLTLAQKIPT